MARVAGIALLLALVALVGRDAARNVAAEARAVADRFELDYGEGPILAQTLDVMRGARSTPHSTAVTASPTIRPYFTSSPPPSPRSPETRSPQRQRTMAELLARIGGTPGPVLSQNMTLLTLAGKEIQFQPFEMTQLARQGLWDPAPFLARIERGQFALVVLGFDVGSPSVLDLELFSEDVLASMRRAYEPTGRVGDYRLYEPSKRTSPHEVLEMPAPLASSAPNS